MGEESADAATAPEQEGAGVPPRTYLIWSALAAALLFLPLGLVALALSLRTRALIHRGDMQRARRMSRVTLAMLILTIVVGVVVYAALVGALLALGAFSGN
ncbi:MAG: CD225/dispanin family protein [Candidatus Nanopelagicales bacterium]|jgi:uncharacterized membrane protein YozB (DUF420 family)